MRLYARLPRTVTTGKAHAPLAAALTCCAVAAVAFFVLRTSSGGGTLAAVAAYGSAAIFSAWVLATSAARIRDIVGTFWTLVSVGVLFRLVGTFGLWASRVSEPEATALLLRDAAYVLSYAAFFAALLWLVAKTTTRITFLSALDALAVMFSIGLLAWFFVLDPAWEAGFDRRATVVALCRLVADASLLFLGLVVLSTSRKPPFTAFLVGAFAAFLVADALHLHRRSSGFLDIGGWPELAWALGLVLIGFAALWSASPDGLAREVEIEPWRVFSFWLGPLSPAMHLGLLLAWGIFYPPLPSYVLVGAVVISAYFALRMGLVARSMSGVRIERERLAACEEQSRLSEDLHDNLKQEVHSVPLMLELHREAEADGDQETAEEILNKAMETSKGASYKISRPVWELRASSGATVDALVLLRQTLRDINRCSPINAREDLQAPLDELRPEELAATYRIVSESLWNAAKHSGAKNVTVSSRVVGDGSLVVEVCDDGRGLPVGDSSEGLGLSLMRTRAEKVEAALEILSKSGEGMTVRMRLKRR